MTRSTTTICSLFHVYQRQEPLEDQISLFYLVLILLQSHGTVPSCFTLPFLLVLFVLRILPLVHLHWYSTLVSYSSLIGPFLDPSRDPLSCPFTGPFASGVSEGTLSSSSIHPDVTFHITFSPLLPLYDYRGPFGTIPRLLNRVPITFM